MIALAAPLRRPRRRGRRRGRGRHRRLRQPSTPRGRCGPTSLGMLAFGGAARGAQRAPAAAAYGFVALLVLIAAALLPPPRASSCSSACCCSPTPPGPAAAPALAWCGSCRRWSAAIVVADLAVTSTRQRLHLPRRASRFAAYGAGRNAVFRGALAAELHEATLRAEEAQAAEERRAVAARAPPHRARDARRRRALDQRHGRPGRRRAARSSSATPSAPPPPPPRSRSTGRETLIEMRRLLGVMHRGEAPAELEPQPDARRPRRAVSPATGAPCRCVGHTAAARRPASRSAPTASSRRRCEDVRARDPGRRRGR